MNPDSESTQPPKWTAVLVIEKVYQSASASLKAGEADWLYA